MNDNWNYNERSPKKTVLFVLVTIILIMIIAILCLVFFKLLKGDKSPHTAESSITTTIAETTQTTTEATTTTTETTTKKTTTKKVTTTKETTTPAPTTVKAAAEKATASAYIEEISFYPQGNGSSFVLHVSGNYSYYHYEGYYTGGGAYDSNCASGKTSNSSVELTAGSVMSEVRAVVTPYNSNGVAGDKIYTSIHPQYSSGALNSDYNDNYASQDEPYAPENDYDYYDVPIAPGGDPEDYDYYDEPFAPGGKPGDYDYWGEQW